GSILRTDDVIGWLRLPCGARNGLTEKISLRRHLGGPDQALFSLRQVSRELGHARSAKPYSPIHHLDVLEDWCRRIFVLVGLCRGPVVRRQRADIDQRRHSLVSAGGRDDSAAVRMTHENDRAAGASERGSYGGCVVGNSVQMVLGRDHLETVSLKKRNDLTETRS